VKPTYAELLSAINSIYHISEVFPLYELRGVSRHGHDFTLVPDGLVLSDGMAINIVPRYATIKFHIVTWSVEYNRHQCRKLMKEGNVAGSVTRDNTDSICVVMEHPRLEELERIYARVNEVVSTDSRGYCHEAEQTFGWGSLESVVKTHRGTAKRDDGVPSWEDDDAKSASTYFNTPLTDDDIDLS
jgi:hypothetical protein